MGLYLNFTPLMKWPAVNTSMYIRVSIIMAVAFSSNTNFNAIIYKLWTMKKTI